MKQGLTYRFYRDFQNHKEQEKTKASNFESYITIISSRRNGIIEESENIKELI